MTGLPNLKEIEETPYGYSADQELPFNANGLGTGGLVRTSREIPLSDDLMQRRPLQLGNSMNREELDTMIVSDVHFGSMLCNTEILLK